jgi:hypothetical protein
MQAFSALGLTQAAFLSNPGRNRILGFGALPGSFGGAKRIDS